MMQEKGLYFHINVKRDKKLYKQIDGRLREGKSSWQANAVKTNVQTK